MRGENTSIPEGLPRPVEIALALGGLWASLPVLAVASAAISLSSKGPVLFKQKRIGRGGRPFVLFKLRTMRTDAEGPNVTSSGDRRVTPIGRILRKTKLDELPELWNVVKGDLSFVGARPEVPEYVDLDDPLWQKVLEARPGLTHPVTLQLRNEEELLARAPGDRATFYARSLVPYKLQGYVEHMAKRSWRSDVEVIARTLLAVAVPALTQPPSVDEVLAKTRSDVGGERASGRGARMEGVRRGAA
jgi:lipopolysaccharide/colanic/teichoic acid biosynthesis glycosyltransferase